MFKGFPHQVNLGPSFIVKEAGPLAVAEEAISFVVFNRLVQGFEPRKEFLFVVVHRLVALVHLRQWGLSRALQAQGEGFLSH